jgi:hypothetical protein
MFLDDKAQAALAEPSRCVTVPPAVVQVTEVTSLPIPA